MRRDELSRTIWGKLEPFWKGAQPLANKAWWFTDEEYYLPPKNYIEQLVLTVIKNNLQVAPLGEKFDCDDYAFALKGLVSLYVRTQAIPNSLCFGIVEGLFKGINAVHCRNWVYTAENELWWVEPQGGSFIPFGNIQGVWAIAV